MVGYLKDPIQTRDDDGAALDMEVGVVYSGDMRAAVLCSKQSVTPKKKEEESLHTKVSQIFERFLRLAE